MLKINSAIMDLFYPVGTYYETSNIDFDPNVAWGGTWVLDSQGKVTVSQDTTDSDFDTLGETGGEKKHTLTINEMPSHSHPIGYAMTGGLGTTVAIMSYTPSSTFRTDSVGGGQPHNIVQPYVVVKRWHRTA